MSELSVFVVFSSICIEAQFSPLNSIVTISNGSLHSVVGDVACL